MAIEVKLPELGDGIDSGDVLDVLVAEGDVISKDQPLCEIETDKATVPIPSSHAGKVLKIHISTGDSVPVGGVLVTLEASEESPSPEPAASAPPATTASEPTAKAETKPETPSAAGKEESPPATPKTPSAPRPYLSSAHRPPPNHPLPRRPRNPSRKDESLRRDRPFDAWRGKSVSTCITCKEPVPEVELRATMSWRWSGNRPNSPPRLAVPRPQRSHRLRQRPLMRRQLRRTKRPLPTPGARFAPNGRRRSARRSPTRCTNPGQRSRGSPISMMRMSPRLERIRQASKADYSSRGLKLTTMPFVIKSVAMAVRE